MASNGTHKRYFSSPVKLKRNSLPSRSVTAQEAFARFTSNGGGTTEDAAITPRELGTGYPEPGKIGTLPAYGIYARHAKGLELTNIHLNFDKADLRPAAAFTDVDGLEIDNLKPQVADGVKAAVFAEDVKDLTIRNSPAVH